METLENLGVLLCRNNQHSLFNQSYNYIHDLFTMEPQPEARRFHQRQRLSAVSLLRAFEPANLGNWRRQNVDQRDGLFRYRSIVRHRH